jgi:hypothetical protein
VFASILILVASGCTIGRVYIGSEIRSDPKERIVIGSTTKGDVLNIYGPPDRIQMQHDGDIFIYAYLRKNSATLRIEEPVITNVTLFTFSRIQQKKDSLVILFDRNGITMSYGFYKGTKELKPY